MIAITHFALGSGSADEDDFAQRAEAALTALAARPGYLRGTLGRCTDDEGAWLLLTEWRDVGSYRRAIGAYDVKLAATPLFATALDVPGGFEELLDVTVGGDVIILRASDREPGA